MESGLCANRNRGGCVYLLALILPAFTLVDWLRAPYQLYQFEAWALPAVIPVCLIQFVRPTRVGRVLVLAEYACSMLRQMEWHVLAFMDLGSEDHSRWEGWDSELFFLGVTACFIVVIVLVAIPPPRKVVHTG